MDLILEIGNEAAKMSNVAYCVFRVHGDGDGYLVFDLEQIYATLEDAKGYARMRLNDPKRVFGEYNFEPIKESERLRIGDRDDFAGGCGYGLVGYLVEKMNIL